MRSQWAARILAQKGTSYYLRSSSFEEDGDDNHEGTGAAAVAGPKKKKAPRQSQIIDDTVKRNNLALCTSYVKYIASRRGTHAFARVQRILTSLVQTRIMNAGFSVHELLQALSPFRSVAAAVLAAAGTPLTAPQQDALDLVTQQAISHVVAVYEKSKVSAGGSDAPVETGLYPPPELFLVGYRNARGPPRAMKLWTKLVPTDPVPDSLPMLGALVNDRYVIQKHIAFGSFKHGWLAHDIRRMNRDGTHVKVFLSTLRAYHDREHAAIPERVLANEMEVIRRLQVLLGSDQGSAAGDQGCENIVQILEVTNKNEPKSIVTTKGLRTSLHYCVTDWCEGGELYAFLAQGQDVLWPTKAVANATCAVNLEEPVARALFKQLMEAVHYLHKRNFFHRDLKMANIFMAKNMEGEWVLKLGDFGTVVHQDRLPSASTAGPTNPVVGEPNANLNYQAPEVVPDGLYDGGPADIWQCGLILLNMVCLSHLEAWDTSQGCPWKMAADPWGSLCAHIDKLGRSNKCFGPVHACWVPVYRFLAFFSSFLFGYLRNYPGMRFIF